MNLPFGPPVNLLFDLLERPALGLGYPQPDEAGRQPADERVDPERGRLADEGDLLQEEIGNDEVRRLDD